MNTMFSCRMQDRMLRQDAYCHPGQQLGCIAVPGASSTADETNSGQSDLAQQLNFVSDSSRQGHAVYCFELAPFPYVFLEQVCPEDTLELSHDAMALEGRGIAQALEHMLTEPLINRLDGASVNWYSNSQTLVDRLISKYESPSNKILGVNGECIRINTAMEVLNVHVTWHWLSRKIRAIKLADQLSRHPGAADRSSLVRQWHSLISAEIDG